MNNLLYQQIYLQYQRERKDQMEIANIIQKNDDFMRYMMGGPVNAAQQLMMESVDYIAGRKTDHHGNPIHAHPKYQFKVRAAFKKVFKEWQAYHARLKTAKCLGIGLFHLGDMAEEDRRRFGNITDADLYEWWRAFGPTARRDAQPIINALQHKIALSLERHGVAYPEHIAWSIVGDSALQVAQYIFNSATESVHTTLPMFSLDYIRRDMYGAFSVQRICDAYRYAIKLLEPCSFKHKLDDIEEKNIAYSYQQLKDAWLNPTAPFDAALEATEEYGEDIFRTRGFQKKAMHEIKEMRRSIEEQSL